MTDESQPTSASFRTSPWAVHEPKPSDYGLDGGAEQRIRNAVKQFRAAKKLGAIVLCLLVYTSIVIVSWPSFGYVAPAVSIPLSFIVGGLFLWLASKPASGMERRVLEWIGYGKLVSYEKEKIKYAEWRLWEQRQKEFAVANAEKSADLQRWHEAEREGVKLRECLQEELVRQQGRRDFWDGLSASELERHVALLYGKLGYTTELTASSGDGGVDVILTRQGKITFVQCKQYRGKMGPAPVRELLGAITQRGADRGVVVCPGGFTHGAKRLAKAMRIRLVDVNGLVTMAAQCSSESGGDDDAVSVDAC